MSRQADLLVFSHLRWDFVWQRPQHLLTRLASDRRVFFIEEPIIREGAPPAWELHTRSGNVSVYRPFSPVPVHGFQDEQFVALRPLLARLLAEQRIVEPVIWFYTPLALPLATGLHPRAIVYDCMDELSAFRGARRGSSSARRNCFGRPMSSSLAVPACTAPAEIATPTSTVSPAVSRPTISVEPVGDLPEPDDQASLKHPRLGFFGVIDERFDIPLLDKLARARPDWQFVMIGPVVKIDPASLPHHPNVHYTGPRSYASLPAYLSGWDVCLLPFALNESTRFISPTKTLEYMAAEKPIVSTPIADVIEPYGDIVYGGKTPRQILAACERA